MCVPHVCDSDARRRESEHFHAAAESMYVTLRSLKDSVFDPPAGSEEDDEHCFDEFC